MVESRRRLLALASLAAPFAVFLIVYAPDVGHGFIADDFRWILENRMTRPVEIFHAFSRNTGFYRPLVALTFAADAAVFGARPLGYGVTNLALAIGCAGLLYALLRALNLPREAAAFGSAVWLMNFHGVPMALLWISGRTALVVTGAALATAIAVIRGRVVLAAVFLILALFAKEEAVTLPFTLLVWLVVLGRDASGSRRVHPAVWMAVSCVPLAIYGVLRTYSGAMTLQSAPWFYRFTFSPGVIAYNLAEYLDRTLTFAIAVCVLAILVLRPAWRKLHVSAPIVVCGLTWILGGYALTLFLPVRSDLYALFPSVGSAIIAAKICTALWRESAAPARQRAMIAGIAVVIVLMPVYRARNHRWTDLADFSTSTLGQLQALTAPLPDGAHVVIVDDRSTRVNLGSAFGFLLNDAVMLHTGRRLDIWVDALGAEEWQAGPPPPCPSCVAMTLSVRNGVLTPRAPRF